MTDAAALPLNPALNEWLEGWEKCMQVVLSQITGHTVAFEASTEPLPGVEFDLWFTVVAGGSVRGEMTLRLPADSVIRLAQKFLQATESAPNEPTAEHKEALEELLRQVA